MVDNPVPAASAFDAVASEYDHLRRALVPCFDDFYGTALDLIDDWRPDIDDQAPLRCLDLGAGTGLFSALLKARRPKTVIHLMDASAAMLDQAKTRFAGQNDISFETADMASAALGGPYDLVISALAIHHLDHGQKRALLGRIYAALGPGGLFVNAEQVLGPSRVAETRYRRLWRAHAAARGVSETEIEKALQRMAHDQCATVADQLDWLRQAGFTDVDCSYKSWRFAVLGGRKPDPSTPVSR